MAKLNYKEQSELIATVRSILDPYYSEMNVWSRNDGSTTIYVLFAPEVSLTELETVVTGIRKLADWSEINRDGQAVRFIF